ncbi:MAG: hypothetical protein V4628_15255 [Pseudomonadota bacterium]
MNLPTNSNPHNILALPTAALSIAYGILRKILDVFLLMLVLMLVSIPLVSTAQTTVELSSEQLDWLGQQIFRNECNNNPACLTAWNEGEDFPSFGIGHFIWYRDGQQEIYTESFPDLLGYIQTQGVQLPAWIVANNFEQPWATRAEFLAAYDGEWMQELRNFLATHADIQTAFIVSRFNLALDHVLAAVPANEKAALSKRFYAVANTNAPYGLYALIDYIHFKGEGSNTAERYQGQGWGLLQVLQAMPAESSAPLDEFVASARNMLAQRVANAPPERREQRWLDGWNNRLSTYLPESH